MQASTIQTQKLEELILYLCDRSESDPAFCATKLNRLLFHLDFTAYVRFGASITGAQYRQEQHEPRLIGLAHVLAGLSSRGALALRDGDDLNGRGRRLFALRSANVDVLTPREVDLVNRVVDRCRGLSARETADRLCDFPAVKIAEEDELVPYEIALVGQRLPTADEIRRAEDLVELGVGFRRAGHCQRCS